MCDIDVRKVYTESRWQAFCRDAVQDAGLTVTQLRSLKEAFTFVNKVGPPPESGASSLEEVEVAKMVGGSRSRPQREVVKAAAAKKEVAKAKGRKKKEEVEEVEEVEEGAKEKGKKKAGDEGNAKKGKVKPKKKAGDEEVRVI